MPGNREAVSADWLQGIDALGGIGAKVTENNAFDCTEPLRECWGTTRRRAPIGRKELMRWAASGAKVTQTNAFDCTETLRKSNGGQRTSMCCAAIFRAN
jgi:methionine synthase I (cobalamin-dependent)